MILDEVHHGGDALSWGDALREAYEPRGTAAARSRARRSAATPRRSRSCEYHPDEQGIRLSRTDYDYGYGRALADGVVRPCSSWSTPATMRWRTKAGDEMEAQLGQDNTKDITAQAWRTALEPDGRVDPRGAARRGPPADRGAARQFPMPADSSSRPTRPRRGRTRRSSRASRARRHASCSPTRRRRRARIEEFSGNTRRWMVAVRMVSEGVDVPRLAVGVYATSASTPLFFAQAVGRFVRARRRGETASVFLPNVPPLMTLAAELERERDHALDRAAASDDDGARRQTCSNAANREERASEEAGARVHVAGARVGCLASTACSTTAASSARSPSPAATRSRSSSASRDCSSPSRSPSCSGTGRPARQRRAGRAAQAHGRVRASRAGRAPPHAEGAAAAAQQPGRALGTAHRRGRTRRSTPSCAGCAAGRPSPRPP